MNPEDRNEINPTYRRFRGTMHLSMGVIYLVMAGIVLSGKVFLQLDPAIAYAVGGLMFLYGLFRIWRGFRDMRMNRRENNKTL